MPLTTVTFDVWETIFKERRDRGEARSAHRIAGMAAVLRRHGFPVEPGAVEQAYRRLWGELESELWKQNRDVDTPVQIERFLDLLFGEAVVRLSPAGEVELTAAYVDSIFVEPPLLVPGLPAALAEIRRRGYRIGVVCNTGVTPGRAVRRLFQDWGILDYFDALGFSNELGTRKPAPEIFRHVLAALGARPAEAVHIGDNLVADILGAKQAGMKAVLVAPEPPASPPAAPDRHVADVCAVVDVLEEL